MKVHLRSRIQTIGGRISLYLEIYKGTCKTTEGKVKILRDYEYLDLYLIDKPKSPKEKQENKEIWNLAESIRAKRELEIKNGVYGFASDFKKGSNFIEYFVDQANKRKESKGNFGNWDSAYKQLIKYAGENVSFKKIDTDFCEGFKEYLRIKARTKSGLGLTTSSMSSYFGKFRACLKKAVQDKILPSSPCTDIVGPNVIESQREYLTIEELKTLAKTECRYDSLKRAFLFSCLTGLRWSDVHKLEWKELSRTEEGWRITFHQKKTKGLQYLDITEQARSYLGETGGLNERVFTGLRYSSNMNMELTRWMLKAGITKNITYHCSRHTFAVMILNLHGDIYTLSKLLGHANVKTTQVYAHIVDAKKREIINKIPDISL